MSKVYIRLLAITALAIAFTGASFSIAGLAKLFAGASTAVAIMAAALEIAKLVVTGFVYRYWGHIHKVMRVYLCFAVVTLIGITSIGIYGFLSNAYQISSLGMKTEELKIESMRSENKRIEERVAEINRFIDEVPRSRISKKFEFQKKYEPEIKRLRKQSDAIVAQIDAAKVKILKTHTEVGPASFLADALHSDVDTVVKYLILLFVLVFDPLAVCLVFCLNLAIRLREKYRGNETKISEHSISTPVDHRFRKAS
ncbi:MAG: hypothetical protein HY075_11830 [Deltaproteobacteria bacterium]|nr:hypothetical protein [Deltaproteobacteria bacterium]